MAPGQLHLNLEALRKLEASLKPHLCEQERRGDGDSEAAPASPSRLSSALCGEGRTRLRAWCPRLRQFAIVGGTVGGLVMLALVALWWRLSSGPIELDIATPWLTAAIKENFGAGHEVEIGGTQLERDANKGRTSLRIRDIVVRDADGTIVASAPKAEVGISGASLFLGRIRAERLSLVGVEMAVRIEPDGEVTVFAGSNKRPLVTASAVPASVVAPRMGPPSKPEQRGAPTASAAPAAALAPTPASARSGIPDLAALIAWIESLDASGLDGRDLTEIGLQGGNLTVDDQRNGKQWTFTNIDLSVTRPKGGGIAVTLGSQGGERPWHVRAAMTPGQQLGHRIIDIETQKLSTKDVMLAMRVSADQYEVDLPLSGRIRADVGPDGVPHMLDGRVLVEKGIIVDLDDPLVRIPIERAEISLDWDKSRRALTAPFQVVSGSNRITLLAQFDAPSDGSGVWGLQISGGSAVLAAAPVDPNALILNRVLLRMRIDANKQRVDLEPSEVGNTDLGVALTGSLDFSGDDPRVTLGIAGTRMSVAALKRLWPLTVSPKVRAWVIDHVQAGTVERLGISTNALWSTLKSSGPAAAGRRFVDPDHRQRRRNPAGRRLAGDPRR